MFDENITLIPKDDTDTEFSTCRLGNNDLCIELPRGVLMQVKYLDLDQFYIMENSQEISKEKLNRN